MPLYQRTTHGRERINLDTSVTRPFKSGGAGHVYQHPGNSQQVIKLYKSVDIALDHREKVMAMLDNPPDGQLASSGGRVFVQIAWPQTAIEDSAGRFVGFSMPLIVWDETTVADGLVQRSSRRREHLREDLRFRVAVARNLSSVLRELHRRGHFFIDLHSANFRVYKQEGFVSLFDTDGYSIRGSQGQRYHAGYVLDAVLSPEGHGRPYSDLGEQQDRYALAVLIFQLINEGLHPFGGVERPGYHLPTTISERVKCDLYSYGRVPRIEQGPSPFSIHEWLDDDTRALFDDAFATRDRRPSAANWRDHLADLQVRARECPNDADHWHFSAGCPWCGRVVQIPAPGPVHPATGGGMATNPVGASPKQASPVTGSSQVGPNWPRLVVGAGIIVVVVLALLASTWREAPSPPGAVALTAAPSAASANPPAPAPALSTGHRGPRLDIHEPAQPQRPAAAARSTPTIASAETPPAVPVKPDIQSSQATTAVAQANTPQQDDAASADGEPGAGDMALAIDRVRRRIEESNVNSETGQVVVTGTRSKSPTADNLNCILPDLSVAVVSTRAECHSRRGVVAPN